MKSAWESVRSWEGKYLSKIASRSQLHKEDSDPDMSIQEDEANNYIDDNFPPIDSGSEQIVTLMPTEETDLLEHKDNQSKTKLGKLLKKISYYLFPIMLWLPYYNIRENLLSDFIAGVGIACIMIPQSLAYANLAKLPPVLGLYTSWISPLIFACFTTSRHLSSGPDSVTSLLLGDALLKSDRMSNNVLLASVYAFIVGLTLITLGIFRFGFIDNILSRPLLSGFVNAVALTLVISQLHSFFGIKDGDQTGTLQKLWHFLTNLNQINWTTFLMGILSLFILFGLQFLKKRFPNLKFLKYLIGNLIVVILGILLSYFLHFKRDHVAILGDIPTDFPIPSPPALDSDSFQSNFWDASIIAIIGFVESIVASKIFAIKYQYTVSPNRELVALGSTNLISSFFHAYPSFGSLTRTVVAEQLGAKSQIYNIVASFFILMTILFLSPYFHYMPIVIMNSIVIVASTHLFDHEELLVYIKIRSWKDLLQFWITFIIAVVFGSDLGLFVGIGTSLLIVVRHTTVPHVAVLGKCPDNKFRDILSKNAEEIRGYLVIRVDEGLFFANIEQLKIMLKRLEYYGNIHAHPTEDIQERTFNSVIIDSKNVRGLDGSAIQAIVEIVKGYRDRHINVCFVKLLKKYEELFEKLGLGKNEGSNKYCFDSIQEAIDYSKVEISEPSN